MCIHLCAILVYKYVCEVGFYSVCACVILECVYMCVSLGMSVCVHMWLQMQHLLPSLPGSVNTNFWCHNPAAMFIPNSREFLLVHVALKFPL